VSTPASRELFIEKILSQNRNTVASVKGDGVVTVGSTHNYTVTGGTATQGYEQLVFSTQFPNNIFQVLTTTQTYSANPGVTNWREYADGCGWNPIVGNAQYRSCVGLTPFSPQFLNYDKAGGQTIISVYTVKIIGTGSATLGALILDFSGSSYHYNSDFGGTVLSVTAQSPTLAEVTSFQADSYNNGTLLRWSTGYEVDNLGFNVYREERGKRTLLNPSLVAGAALKVAGGNAPTGESYTWVDSRVGTGKATYWLEDVDLNGNMKMHGPYTTLAHKGLSLPSQAPERALLLSDLARSDAPSRAVAKVPGRSPVQAGGDGVAVATQEYLSSKGAAKISVVRDGWHRVTLRQLQQAGFDISRDTRFLQLYVGGAEVPMLVSTPGSKRMGPTIEGYIEFYGLAQDTATTGSRTYWLINGAGQGARIPMRAGDPQPGANPASFPYTLEAKERILYFTGLRNGDVENFFGPLLSSSAPVRQIFDVRELDPQALEPAQLEVALQGVTAQSHTVSVKVNGFTVGVVTSIGQERPVARFNIPASVLHDGENEVSLNVTGGTGDVNLTNYLRLTYPRRYTAENDTLTFSAKAQQGVLVNGFSSPSIRVIDVTDAASPLELRPTVLQGQNGYSVQVEVPGSDEATHILVAFTDTDGAVNGPAAVVLDQASNWRGYTMGADLVIISHRDFMESVKPLAVLRRSQGLSVAVVDAQDVYDEFSYGEHTPVAIKEMLDWTRLHWQKAPRYVLLAGDGSLDPRNYLGRGEFDFVPTKLVDTDNMEAASDGWLADFDGDGLPEMAIGRLPVRTRAEANNMVSKIVTQANSIGGSGAAVLVADLNNGYDFEGASAALRELIPGGVPVQSINRSQGTTEQVRARILEEINAGPGLVNFAGHGNVNTWTTGLLTNDDAATLHNGRNLPIFVMMTCLNGYFQDPTLDSLGESLLKAQNGGALAVWASSGMVTPGSQAVMDRNFVQSLYGPEHLMLGDAALRAKASVSDPYARATWNLLGDPTSRLP
jgi:hypothetical protein